MRQKSFTTGILLILGALSFWVGRVLLPEPGLSLSFSPPRTSVSSATLVVFSSLCQALSAVCITVSLTLLASISFAQKNVLRGIVLILVGCLGVFSDALMDITLFYLTANPPSTTPDKIQLINTFRKESMLILLPFLLSFLAGSFLLSHGLLRQRLITKKPALLMKTAVTIGPAAALLLDAWRQYEGSAIVLASLFVFTGSYMVMGYELIWMTEKLSFQKIHPAHQVLNIKDLNNNYN